MHFTYFHRAANDVLASRYARVTVTDETTGVPVWQGRVVRRSLKAWTTKGDVEIVARGLADAMNDQRFARRVIYKKDTPVEDALADVFNIAGVTFSAGSSVVRTGALWQEHTRDFVLHTPRELLDEIVVAAGIAGTPVAWHVEPGLGSDPDFQYGTLSVSPRYAVDLNGTGIVADLSDEPTDIVNRLIVLYDDPDRYAGDVTSSIVTDALVQVPSTVSYNDIPILRDRGINAQGAAYNAGQATNIAQAALGRATQFPQGWSGTLHIPYRARVENLLLGGSATVEHWRVRAGKWLRIDNLSTATFGAYAKFPDYWLITRTTWDEEERMLTVQLGGVRSLLDVMRIVRAKPQASVYFGGFPKGAEPPARIDNSTLDVYGPRGNPSYTGELPAAVPGIPSFDPSQQKIVPSQIPPMPPVANFVIDGGRAVITTGFKGALKIPPMRLTRWALIADQVGTIQVDIGQVPEDQPASSTVKIFEAVLAGTGASNGVIYPNIVSDGYTWLTYTVIAAATVTNVTVEIHGMREFPGFASGPDDGYLPVIDE